MKVTIPGYTDIQSEPISSKEIDDLKIKEYAFILTIKELIMENTNGDINVLLALNKALSNIEMSAYISNISSETKNILIRHLMMNTIETGVVTRNNRDSILNAFKKATENL